MPTCAFGSKDSKRFENLKITTAMAEAQTLLDNHGLEPREEITSDNVELIFGFGLLDLYKIAMKYYKENEKNGNLVVDYQIRVKFIALAKQTRYGVFKEEHSNYGWFDLVGSDSANEWRRLGDISVEQSMLEFVKLLDVVCPTFRPYVKEKAAIEVASNKLTNYFNGDLGDSKEVIEKYQQQKKQIQEALNQQTHHQFLAYAQQTYPGDPIKQQELIQQLQEQHFEQYMSQVYSRQSQMQAEALETTGNKEQSDSDSEAGPKPKDAYLQEGLERPPSKEKDGEDSEAEDEETQDELPLSTVHANPKIAPANLWNSKNIVEFKETIRKDGPEGIIKVGHGESVTVRVPTHEEGTCLFWEFATDWYDIGFGVYFEWTVAQTNQITVHISESDEEEDEELEEGIPSNPAGDVESGGSARQQKPRDPSKPQVDEVIPVYRRASHEEVYAGSHSYPGRGVYLLKFDNSYSLWRSKTLYYRVFYSK
ncbi:hypothetical protein M3Y97_00048100 [Aphelenchoides bicaudatus]|nr:hypothetical protein M3Y97_00048100 [Aphelenchoides bicaudatus]